MNVPTSPETPLADTAAAGRELAAEVAALPLVAGTPLTESRRDAGFSDRDGRAPHSKRWPLEPLDQASGGGHWMGHGMGMRGGAVCHIKAISSGVRP